MAELQKPPYQNKVTDPDGYMDKGWLSFFTTWAQQILSGFVQSVTGVAGRILVTGTSTNPIVNIDPAYVASAAQGGTGQSSYLLGDTLYASGPSALSKLPGVVPNKRYFLGQAGTGVISAAPTWLPVHIFDVTDPLYGADPTGTIVSTAAIQAAYDAAKANVTATNGGGVLYLPAGVYLSGELNFDSPFVSILGDGPGASEIRSTGTGVSLFKLDGGNTVGAATHFNITVSGLKIAHNQTSGAWTNIVHLHNCSEINFYNVWIEGTTLYTDYALYLESALTINFDSCIMRAGKVDTIRAKKKTGLGEAYPNFLTFRKCLIKSAGEWGFHYTDGEGVVISDCDMSANGGSVDANHGAIYIHDCGNEVGAGLGVTIEYTRFEATSGVHVKVGATGFAPGGVLLFACSAGGAKFGVYCDVTAPSTARVFCQYSSFVGCTDYDYYFGNDATGYIYDCRGITASLTKRCIAIPIPQDNSQCQIDAGRRAFVPGELANNSSNPSVAYYGPVYLAANSSLTSIDSFPGSKDGDEVTVFATNGNSTIIHQAGGPGAADGIDCPGGQDWHIAGNSTVTFIRANGRWRPKAFCTLGNRERYEEGEYVATLTPETSGSITIISSRENLAYTRQGRLVTITGRIDIQSVSSPVGAVHLSLPAAYPVGTLTQMSFRTLGQIQIENYPNTQLFLRAREGETNAEIMFNNAGVFNHAAAADFATGQQININLSYFVD